MKKLLLTIIFAIFSTNVSAQDWLKGWKAYRSSDYSSALQEWLPLAKQGEKYSQQIVGHMYETGKGVLQDYTEATKWYRLSARQGLSGAQKNLGNAYKNGKGLKKDKILAHMWFNIASATGSEEARKSRNIIAINMTSKAIEKALAMARECMESGYNKCGY